MTEPTDAAAAPDETPEQPNGEREPDPAEPGGTMTTTADRPAVEVVQPEVVAEPDALPAVPPPPSALERAAHELMETPGAPGRDEFLVLATTARILSMSAGAPAAIRNNPWLAFHLALIGRDLGISPSAALQQIDVIGYDERTNNYDKAQLSLSPELLNGQIRRLGLGSIVPAASSADACTAVALAPGGRLDPRCARIWPEHVPDGTPGGPCRCTLDLVLGEHTFTWEDAQQANLADSACVGPKSHTAACLNGGSGTSGKRCHQGYRTYPKRMMWWRAAGYAASDYFPEAGLGLYSPEELGAVVDPETGRPVDPGDVELPEGYEPPPEPHNPALDPLCDALPDDCADLRARIDRITAAGGGASQALREMWTAPTGENGEGPPTLPPFARLQRRHKGKAVAMVRSVEARIKRGEWGDDVKAAWSEATQAAADAAKAAAEAEGDTPGPDDGDDGGAVEPATGSDGGDDPTPGAAPAAPETQPGAPAPAESDADREARVVAEYEAAVAGSAVARHEKAAKLAAEAGLTLPGTEPGAAVPPADEPIDWNAEAAKIAEEVRALSPTDVRAALVDRQMHDEAALNPQAQRTALAIAIYRERGGPEPEASGEDEPA